MAYVNDPNQQQQQQQQAGPSTTMPAPVSTSSAPGAGPSGSKTPTGTATSQQSAQPFTNLQSYLTANAPQIQQQANTISGNLTNQYGQVKNDINNGVGAFNTQVAQGYTPENPGLVQQAAANPAQFVQTPGNVSAFQSQINDQYTGPANFEGTSGYSGLNNEVTNAAANASLFNTPSGIQTYLQGTEKNPTQGENLLDSVLLQQSPQAIQQVQKAAQPFSQLPDYLSGQVTTANQGVTTAQTNAQQTAQAAQQALANAQAQEQANINSGLKSLQDQIAQYNSGAGTQSKDINSENAVLKQFADFLASQQYATYTPTRNASLGPGLAPNFYLEPGNPGLPKTNIPSFQPLSNATLSNSMTDQDLATISALQQLVGNQDFNPAPGVTSLSPINIPNAENYTKDMQNFENSLTGYLGNVAFGLPVNNPVGQGGFGWVPSTTGNIGIMNAQGNTLVQSDAKLQALINAVNALS